MPADASDDQDRAAILDHYRSQHRAMIEGRTDVLDDLLADEFVARAIEAARLVTTADFLGEILGTLSTRRSS